MADIKISDLVAATSASGAMQLEVNDSSTSKRITVDQLKAFVLPAGSISATELGTDAVTTIKIQNAAVTTAKLNDGSVTPAKLSTGAPVWDTTTRLGIGVGTPTGTFGSGSFVGGLIGHFSGSYFSAGAYYDGTAASWKNTVASQGGWAVLNNNGVFTVATGASPGVAGSNFASFTEKFRITTAGGISVGTSGTAVGTSGQVLTSQGDAPPIWAAAGSFSAGTRMSFNQTAAPTGWTKDTTAALNDSVMRIVTGTVGSGGSTAFSTFNGQTTVGATTLSTTQIPSHSHVINFTTTSGTVTGSQIRGASSANTSTQSTDATGGGGAHNHTITTSIKYNDFIIASKD